MFNVNSPTVFPYQVSNQFLIRRGSLKGILLNDFNPYSFYPQIECTEDGGYVFFVLYPQKTLEYGGKSYTWYGWGELVSADTVPVIMDHYEQDGYKGKLKGNMYLRTDADLESDVQALCDKWCV